MDQLELMIEQKLKPSDDEANVDATELGVEQQTGRERRAEVEARIANVTHYYDTVVKVDPKYAKIVQDCKYRHDLCAFWAVIGEVRVMNYMYIVYIYFVFVSHDVCYAPVLYACIIFSIQLFCSCFTSANTIPVCIHL
jgi:hypothetical protein